MMTRDLLNVKITASYRNARILEDVCFDLAEGELLGIIGGSGAGKSTLVLSLLGLLPWRGGSVSGEILLNGRNLLSFSNDQLRDIRGRIIGLVPQSPMSALNPAISLEKHFKEAWKAHRVFQADEFRLRLHDLLNEVQLPFDQEFLRRHPGQISVGQAQRVLVALAILHNPPIVIADEPTSALDPLNQAQVLSLLMNLNRKYRTAIIYISHDLISVLRLVNRIAVLHRGRIVETIATSRVSHAEHKITRELLSTLPVDPNEIVRSRCATSSPEKDKRGYLTLVG
jgi:ABC-type glutathione transport system ATPase component